MQNQLRILHIVESAGAGVGRHVADLVGGLVDRGDIVDLVYGSSRADDEFRHRLPTLGVRRSAELPMARRPGPGDLHVQLSLRRFIRSHGPYDVIHGHASKGGFHARLLPRNAVRFYTPNALVTQSPHLGRGRRAAYAAVERRLARRTDGLVLVSIEEAQHAQVLGLQPRDRRMIPNGIDPVDVPDRASARVELGLAAEQAVIGFVGRLSPQKGVERLIDAIALVPSDENWTWAIIGEGELSEQLRARADGLGVGGRIRWLGTRPGHVSMPAFDVLVLPSVYEGFPYVALEALQAGVPVIATRTSSVTALLADGRAGQIVDGSPESIAAAVAGAIRDPQGRAEWAAAATTVAARYTAQQMIEATRQFYFEVLETRRAAGREDG